MSLSSASITNSQFIDVQHSRAQLLDILRNRPLIMHQNVTFALNIYTPSHTLSSSSPQLWKRGCAPGQHCYTVYKPLLFRVTSEARKSSEWSAWYRDTNATIGDGRRRYTEERYRCTCHAEVSHASQLRQPVIKKAQRICSHLQGCTSGLSLRILSLLLGALHDHV